MANTGPKILFVCGREPTYVRNAMLWRSFRTHYESRLIADTHGQSLSFRLARLVPRLLYGLRKPHDLITVGFYGHPLVLLARQFSRAPILFDPFVSTFDTLSLDRQIVAPNSLFARFCFKLDQQSLHVAQRLLSDTNTHANYYRGTFGIAAAKIDNLYLGCDETLFIPRRNSPEESTLTVFTYSTYMPLHGMETIVRAAEKCQAYPIRFRLVGDKGPTYRAVRELANQKQLPNLEFISSVSYHTLPDEIAGADICLGGHFGPTAKAERVIAGKTYQYIAMAKPVILGDTMANRELFRHLETAFMCQPDSPTDLAEAILALYQDSALRHRLATNAYRLFQSDLSWARLATHLIETVGKMLS